MGLVCDGGIRHVAAYLAALDLSALRSESAAAKDRRVLGYRRRQSERRKMPSWPIFSTSLAIRTPVTLPELVAAAIGDLALWLKDRKNRRAIPPSAR